PPAPTVTPGETRPGQPRASTRRAAWSPAYAPMSTTAAGASSVEPASRSPSMPGTSRPWRATGPQAQLVDCGAATYWYALHSRQSPEQRLPGDQSGAVIAERVRSLDEPARGEAGVDQLEVRPHRKRADCDRRPDLADQVRPVVGDRTADAPPVDHDFDRLPAE